MKKGNVKKNLTVQSIIKKVSRTYSVYKKPLTIKRIKQKKKNLNRSQTPQNFPISDIIKFKPNATFTQPIETKPLQNQRYIIAIQIIFKTLDVFNRGYINETNINRWISQSALYFLGSVFQKIRLERLSVSLPHFIKECEKIRKISNQQDTETFVNSIIYAKSIQSLKSSKNRQLLSEKTGILKNMMPSFIEPMIEENKQNFQRVRIKTKGMNFFGKAQRKLIDKQENSLTGGIKHIVYSPIKPLVVKQYNDTKYVKPFTFCQNQIKNQDMPLQIKQQNISAGKITTIDNRQLSKNNQEQQNILLQSPSFSLIGKQHSKQNKQKYDTQNAKIDALTLKLEENIRRNAQRIQKSKNICQFI